MLSRILCGPVVLVFLGLLVAPAVSAEPDGKDRPQNAEKRAKLLERFDTNANGQLDPDEKQAAKEAMAKRREQGAGADDRSGAGNPAAGGREGKGKPDPERMKKRLARFDTNNDGKIDEIEKAAAKEAGEQRQAKKAKNQ